MSEQDHILKLLDAVLYGDAFNCAVTFEEVHSYSLESIDEGKLQEVLDEMVAQKLIGLSNGFYYLPGRSTLADERAASIRKAGKFYRRALRVSAWLKHLPFIRGIYLTGSVAADNAEADADLDLMIIITPNRLGMAFAMLAPMSRLLSREIFCPNYYLSEENLLLDRRSHYVAREVVQARPLLGKGNPLLEANTWVQNQFPNFRDYRTSSAISTGSWLQNMLELPLRGNLGNVLEKWARSLAQRRLDAHHTAREVAVSEQIQKQFDEGEALRFHASKKVQSADEDYQRISEQFAGDLYRFRRHPPEGS